jgi:hypothetical protein
VFANVFPEQIDHGERKSTSWKWMMGRIRDGNHIKPPRNLIDLINKSIDAQIRREDRDPRDFLAGQAPLIEADSIKRGLTRLSEERVEDTLLAEAGDLAEVIARFRGLKSEHNDATLAPLLNVQPSEVGQAVKPLTEMGFLEQVGQSYKVPMLYRDGLAIVQGKAF